MVKILAFGSSETWGAFDDELGGWAERLKLYFFNQRSDVLHSVYNLGISSDDTRGLVFRLEKQIEIMEKIDPSDYIFIFSIGKNDVRWFEKRENKVVGINEYEDNIKKIINIARGFSNKILFVGYPRIEEEKVNPWDEGEEKSYYENEALEMYDDKLKELCRQENVMYVRTRDLLSKEDLSDGLHPNAKGHRKIFERVKDELNMVFGMA